MKHAVVWRRLGLISGVKMW